MICGIIIQEVVNKPCLFFINSSSQQAEADSQIT